jgi:hypothetical protein
VVDERARILEDERMRVVIKCVVLLLLAGLAGCGDEAVEEPAASMACTPSQSAPYPSGIPYLGIHADAGNSDVISCATADQFEQVWHALEGMGLTQPNTFSPDGLVTYATTSNPEPDGCRLHALDAITGAVHWCKSYPVSVVQSAVEVDEDGNLYFSVDAGVVSLTAAGEERWSTAFDAAGEGDNPWGVHFTPAGHVATVTTSGEVYLLTRDEGVILASLSIAETWGFVPPQSFDLPIDLATVLPEQVQRNITTVWGEGSASNAGGAFAGFLGAGGFVDNTLAVSASGDLYVVGGGPDYDHGSLVQIKVGGTDAAPELTAGWYAMTNGGSASSPSVSRPGTHVVIADGSGTANLLNPGSIPAAVRVVDIVACDENRDSDVDPAVCAFAWEEPVQRQPLPGAPAILDDGTTIFYEFGLDFSAAPEDRDVIALGPNGVVWETALPGDLDWNSVVTVTDNHIIGTASKVTLSDQQLLGLTFPSFTDDRLVVLDRRDGSLVFEAPIPDDSAATVTVGPDGSLYVGVLGLLSILSIEEEPNLGLVRFAPRLRNQRE